MTTNYKLIANVPCSSSDWPNLLASTKSISIRELDKSIQNILNHPLRSLVSIPFMYSYEYRKAKKAGKLPEAAAIAACRALEEKLNILYG